MIFNWEYDTPLHEAIGQAIGAASMCWENVEAAGIFNSSRALEICEELEIFIKAKQVGL